MVGVYVLNTDGVPDEDIQHDAINCGRGGRILKRAMDKDTYR